MSPPLRTPGSVGATSWCRAPVAAAAARAVVSIRSRSTSVTSSSRVTLYIAQPVNVVSSGGHAAAAIGHEFADAVPPRPERGVGATLPRHLPPRLRARQRPDDGHRVRPIVEPDRWADQHVSKRHAASARAGRVFGEVGVDERPGAPGPGHHPVDHEYRTLNHEPRLETRSSMADRPSRPSGGRLGPWPRSGDAVGMRAASPDPFGPVQLGPLTLRNCVIKAATSEGRSPDGFVTDDLIEFHRAFAAGGVGMTTVAYCCVSREGASAPGQIVMSRGALPGLRRLTDAVNDAGAAISAQLGHAGVVAPKKLTGVTAVAPSRFINPTSFAYCREISPDGIRAVIEQFGAAAQVAIDAGFDAVELHFGHLYLPSSFLSPLINRRKDGYGGSIDNRSRLVREIADR